MSNKAIIEKAELTLADLSNGGLLENEQSNTFVRTLIAQPTLLNQARTVMMGSPKREINKIVFAGRILRPGVSGVALAPVDQAAPVTSRVVLDTKEVIAAVPLPYDVIEDNIEGGNLNMNGANALLAPPSGGLKDTIVALIAERSALDLEDLAINGDTASLDPFLALSDGYLVQTTSNVVNHAAAGTDRNLFRAGMKAMPDAFLRNRAMMRNFVSHDNEIDYRETIANRETAAGDQVISQNVPVWAYGVPVDAVSLMPQNDGLLTMPSNLIFGIQRQISIEVEKRPGERRFIIYLSARVDFKIEEETAVVKYSNIN